MDTFGMEGPLEKKIRERQIRDVLANTGDGESYPVRLHAHQYSDINPIEVIFRANTGM